MITSRAPSSGRRRVKAQTLYANMNYEKKKVYMQAGAQLCDPVTPAFMYDTSSSFTSRTAFPRSSTLIVTYSSDPGVFCAYQAYFYCYRYHVTMSIIVLLTQHVYWIKETVYHFTPSSAEKYFVAGHAIIGGHINIIIP